MTIVYWIIFFIILYIIWRVSEARNNVINVRGHWQKYFDTAQFSVQELYAAIETTVRDKEIPSLQTSRIAYPQGNMFSGNREYLRVSRGTIVFDVCAAPFAKGFFISSWQGDIPDLGRLFVSKIPFIGKALERSFYTKTYFQMDAEQMYVSAVHSGIMQAIEQVSKVQGARIMNNQDQLLAQTKEDLLLPE